MRFGVMPVVGGCVLALLATGCSASVVGHWRMVKAIPNRDVFAIDNASFDREGKFTASVTIDGRTVHEQGVYEFNGFKLTMRPQAGGQHRYNATVRMGNLRVVDGERQVILRKTEQPKAAEGPEADRPK